MICALPSVRCSDVDLPTRIEVRVVEERPDLMCVVLPVDLSRMGHDAIWAMTGKRP